MPSNDDIVSLIAQLPMSHLNVFGKQCEFVKCVVFLCFMFISTLVQK